MSRKGFCSWRMACVRCCGKCLTGRISVPNSMVRPSSHANIRAQPPTRGTIGTMWYLVKKTSCGRKPLISSISKTLLQSTLVARPSLGKRALSQWKELLFQ